MAPGNDAEQAAPVAAPRPKKMRRIGPAFSTADMGVMGALQHLKLEARQLQSAGIRALLAGGPEAMGPHLANYLNGTAARSYEDETGEDMIGSNEQLLAGYTSKNITFDEHTLTIKVTYHAELCFGLHIDLIEKLKTGPLAEDGLPTLFLDAQGGQPAQKSKTCITATCESPFKNSTTMESSKTISSVKFRLSRQ